MGEGRPSRLKLVGIVAAIVAVLLVVWGLIARRGEVHQAQQWSDAQAIPTVAVVRPQQSQGGRQVTLPGDLAAFNAANIFARTSGYIRAWYDDIGAVVKPGQVLAVLDTPDLDQQVIQARADLASAEANRKLSQSTATRWVDLLKSDAVSKQETDEKTGDLAVKTALVKAAQANLDRLLALKGFARITAPFAGVVTARNANIGDLVTAGASGERPLFTVSDVHRIRTYVHVPQNQSADLKPGVQAKLHLPEYPNRTFPATLVSTSGAINDQSGALLVELDSDNPDGALKPGAYAQVEFDLPGSAQVMRLPSSALIFRQQGLQVATLDADDHVHLQHVTIRRDLGPQVEIDGGLAPNARVVDNPPDSLAEGELVRVDHAAHG
ncbi:MAG: efflux RND transporter periplasmic adaptor subunit [Caulobacteraceae bacterium]|nr:efflux RND transporter periplasmic adaptor subunit [Caulobacter sp.]